jgi:hypothetical protein
MGNLRGGEVRALERMGTQRVDSATRGFIPPLNTKKGGLYAAPAFASALKKSVSAGRRQRPRQRARRLPKRRSLPRLRRAQAPTRRRIEAPARGERQRIQKSQQGRRAVPALGAPRVNVLGKSRIIGHPPAQKRKTPPRKGASHREALERVSGGDGPAPSRKLKKSPHLLRSGTG